METQRHRLSLAQVSAADFVDPRSVEDIEDCGYEQLEDKEFVSVTSVTDPKGAKAQNFAQKAENVLAAGFASEEQAVTFLRSKGIGWTCNKGMKPEAPNQDSFAVLYVEGEYAIYGVFDGHGPFGHDVSTEARKELLKLLLNHEERTTDTEKALKESFVQTQKLIESMGPGLDANTSGTTATIVYHDIQNDALYIAHVGDSRAVIAKKIGQSYSVKFETEDHKPNLPKEKKRIESANPPGRVVFDGYYNHRVFSQKGMYPGLNMSRAIGDVVAHKEAGLTAVPDVKMYNLKELRKDKTDDIPLLVCSDGVWEFIESADAFKVHPLVDPQPFVDELAKKSYDNWMQDSDGEISDDITAIYVQL